MGSVLRMSPQYPRLHITAAWHDKVPSALKGQKTQIIQNFTSNGDVSILAKHSPARRNNTHKQAYGENRLSFVYNLGFLPLTDWAEAGKTFANEP